MEAANVNHPVRSHLLFPFYSPEQILLGGKSVNTYFVRLTADAIVSATIRVRAENEAEAQEIAKRLGDDENLYEVDSLHESPTVYEVKAVRP